MRRFKLSNDRQFAAKLRDVVGLYVDPPRFGPPATPERLSTAPLNWSGGPAAHGRRGIRPASTPSGISRTTRRRSGRPTNLCTRSRPRGSRLPRRGSTAEPRSIRSSLNRYGG
jgi:hypothetical protein